MLRQKAPLIALLALLVGCGGGTAGTSGTGPRFLSGKVRSVEGSPLGGLTMEASSERGKTERSITASDGEFGMTVEGSSFLLQLRNSEIQASLSLNASLPPPSTLAIDAQVDGNGAVQAAVFESAVRVSGDCEEAFEVGLSIEQLRPFDASEECFLKLTATGSNTQSEFTVTSGCAGRVVVAGGFAETTELPLSRIIRERCDTYSVTVFHGEQAISSTTLLQLKRD